MNIYDQQLVIHREEQLFKKVLIYIAFLHCPNAPYRVLTNTPNKITEFEEN